MLTTTRTLLLAVALGTPLTVAGAQSKAASAGNGNARTAIEAANARYAAAFNKGDIAEFARVYDADAIVMPPNGEAIRGQQAIADWWQGGWKAGVRNLRLTTLEVSMHGNEASEVGTYQLDMQAADGSNTGGDHGKFIVLWKRNAKGEWKWHRDIYNSDVPAAPASSSTSGGA